MNLDDFSRVADAALLNIETLLNAWLPNGVKEGNEYLIGSRYGEAGRSMRIRLIGDRAGFWSDFASDGEAGRDLISLYAYLNGISQGKACVAVAEQLGITLSGERREAPIVPRATAKPGAQESAPAQPGQGVEAPSEKPRTLWIPILPVPEDAGPYPQAHTVRRFPEMRWEYRDQERRLLGVVNRFKTSDGGKEVLPCVFAENMETKKREWRWLSFPEPRPLYLPGPLRDGFPVLVVEGEKCADVAYTLVRETHDVVTWPGGGKAAKKAYWAPLRGKHCILWPDCDAKKYKKGHAREGQIMPEEEQPGVKAMRQVEEILQGIECTIEMIDIPSPGEKPDGWDVSDLVEEGKPEGWKLTDLVSNDADAALVREWLGRLCKVPAVDIEEDVTPGEDVPPWMIEAQQSDYPSNVMQLHKDSSTPSPAGAKPPTRREIRSEMIPGATPGSVRGCRENVYAALKKDVSLKGIVGLDQFSMLQVKRRQPPWPSEPGEWTEGDDFHLGIFLAKYYGLVIGAIGDIEKAVAQIARENGFNPVADFFMQCADNWDGTERVKHAFSRYWGARHSEYLEVVSRMFFVGLAARVFMPGCKHDDAPVFEGGQGEGKSTALEILAGDWFADTPFRMGDKDGYLSIQGILLYEIAELDSFNRSEVTAVKAFMSSRKDRYREPYGRRMKNQARRTCFAATTNEGQYFKDPTGNRRFWPVKTGRMDNEALRQDREQLIGESVHLMRAGAKWWPTRDEQDRLITPEQDDRLVPDEWTGRIWEYLEGIDSEGRLTMTDKKNRVTARELLTRALHIEIGKISNAKTETGRISAIMRHLGWIKDRETTGAREYFYERPSEKPIARTEESEMPPGGYPEPAHLSEEGMEDDEPLPI